MKKTNTRRGLSFRTVNVISDFVTVSAGWFVFNIIRFYSLPIGYNADLASWLCSDIVLAGQLVVPACMVLLYALSGCYNKTRGAVRSRLDETLNTLAISFIGMLGIFFTTLLNDNIPERLANYEMMLILFACLAVPTMAARITLTTRRTRRTLAGQGLNRAMIVGASADRTDEVQRLIRTAPRVGYKVVAIHNTGGKLKTEEFCGLPVADGELADVCRDKNIRAVILPFMEQTEVLHPGLTDALYRLEMPVFIAPSLSGMLTLRPRLQAVRPEPLIDIASANVSPATKNLKRLADIIGSACALVVLSPLMALVAVAVKLDSKGSVFYRQERIGYHKKPFHIIKFRTMRTDAEAAGPALSSPGDTRITRLGHWLRKYRIDELPQFWNVLLGQMSLVGPRPERAYFAAQILERQPAYALLYHVRPGITSWGMVKYGYAQNVDQMVERMSYDLLYIQNVSLAIDLKILLHTVATVLTGRGV